MKNLKHKSDTFGIYCILNLKNQQIYVGSSKKIFYRLRRHLSDLRANRHHTQHLQNSFNKNGEDNFYSFVIEEVKINELIDREEYWINILKADYNKTTHNLTRPSLSYTQDQRNKISNSMKLAIKEGRANCNRKEIFVYLNSGEFYKKFNSLVDCSIELQTAKSSIIRCINGMYLQANGYQYFHQYKGEKIQLVEKKKDFKKSLISTDAT